MVGDADAGQHRLDVVLHATRRDVDNHGPKPPQVEIWVLLDGTRREVTMPATHARSLAAMLIRVADMAERWPFFRLGTRAGRGRSAKGPYAAPSGRWESRG
jgi:hypothetical protein